MIKEEVDNILQEEESDCWRDYQNGSMTKEEYENCVQRFQGDEPGEGITDTPDWESTKERMKARREHERMRHRRGKYDRPRYY